MTQTYALTVTSTAHQVITSTPTLKITLAATTIQPVTIITQVASTTVSLPATSTYTVPTPSGFTPILSATAAKRDLNAVREAPGNVVRAADLVQRATKTTTTWTISNSRLVCKPTNYPQTVSCGVLVVTYHTAATTRTASSTVTQTVTLQPSTSVVTSTVTITNTATVSAPVPTIYAACAPNNIAPYNGGYTLGGCGAITGTGFDVNSPDIAYACCVICQTTPGCAFSVVSPALPGNEIDQAEPAQCVLNTGSCGSGDFTEYPACYELFQQSLGPVAAAAPLYVPC